MQPPSPHCFNLASIVQADKLGMAMVPPYVIAVAKPQEEK